MAMLIGSGRLDPIQHLTLHFFQTSRYRWVPLDVVDGRLRETRLKLLFQLRIHVRVGALSGGELTGFGCDHGGNFRLHHEVDPLISSRFVFALARQGKGVYPAEGAGSWSDEDDVGVVFVQLPATGIPGHGGNHLTGAHQIQQCVTTGPVGLYHRFAVNQLLLDLVQYLLIFGGIAVGGEGVKPYQPDGMWLAMAHPASNTKKYQRDKGPLLYRRSLYVYWKRTSPHPMMTLFDAPSRETSCVRRSRTNTSLQSLGLLNETQRLEMARALAERLLRDGWAWLRGKLGR